VSDFRYFLDCIEQGRQSDVSADVCSDVLRVLLAAYQSAAERRWVEL
jgi:predicted dehydrogenase